MTIDFEDDYPEPYTPEQRRRAALIGKIVGGAVSAFLVIVGIVTLIFCELPNNPYSRGTVDSISDIPRWGYLSNRELEGLETEGPIHYIAFDASRRRSRTIDDDVKAVLLTGRAKSDPYPRLYFKEHVKCSAATRADWRKAFHLMKADPADFPLGREGLDQHGHKWYEWPGSRMDVYMDYNARLQSFTVYVYSRWVPTDFSK